MQSFFPVELLESDYGKVKLLPSSVTKKEVYMELWNQLEREGVRGGHFKPTGENTSQILK